MLKSRSARIDGLRALAVCGVVLIHSQLLGITSLVPLAAFGPMGVDLFFFLSGYVISLAWDQAPHLGLKGFYRRRFLRVAPLYYLMLTLTYVFAWANNTNQLDQTNFIWHALFAHGFSAVYAQVGIGPMWSLTSEVMFYAVFPLLRRLNTATLAGIFAASLTIPNLGADDVFHQVTSLTALSTLPFGSVKYLIGGMLVYRHHTFFAGTVPLAISGTCAWLLLVMMAQAIAGINLVSFPPSFLLLFACPYLMFSECRPLKTALENRLSRHLGLVSYSAYLVQIPIIYELKQPGYIDGQFALVFAVSTVTYFLVERPFILLSKR